MEQSAATENDEAKEINKMIKKENDKNYVWKLPVDKNCTDYWVRQHYTIKDIEKTSPEDRLL